MNFIEGKNMNENEKVLLLFLFLFFAKHNAHDH